jgi:hypothetical protein
MSWIINAKPILSNFPRKHAKLIFGGKSKEIKKQYLDLPNRPPSPTSRRYQSQA